MSHDELSIDLKTEDAGETLVFVLRGSLDIATSPTVRAALVDAADKGNKDIIVDLTGLEFLDSTGLGALIGAHRRANEHGGSLRVVVREGPILRLLNITGLIRIFSVYYSREDARADHDRVAATL
ncbi:MAG TPA: STAS domain-containing protein [Candidatus Acidoferrales bacterium]|nr:STAS domain-containing protein [Candidatus Acidoferrales bacterium]